MLGKGLRFAQGRDPCSETMKVSGLPGGCRLCPTAAVVFPTPDEKLPPRVPSTPGQQQLLAKEMEREQRVLVFGTGWQVEPLQADASLGFPLGQETNLSAVRQIKRVLLVNTVPLLFHWRLRTPLKQVNGFVTRGTARGREGFPHWARLARHCHPAWAAPATKHFRLLLGI